MNNRIIKGLLGGGLLGLICVVGVSVRSQGEASKTFIFALWYNRVLLGIIMGAPWRKISKLHQVLRGGFFGLLVSFSFYAATGFSDVISFFAGIVYGIVLELYLSLE